jgi:DNA-binding transcriptional LysR family regulator
MAHQLKLRQLTYFIVVAEELSFRRAAERLFITQPPLSRQIKLLEDTLGATLFDRDRQGVRLTEAGHSFLADARALLRESEQVLVRFKPQPLDTKVTLTLGITTVIDVGLFAGIDTAFEKIYPSIRVIVKPQISAHSIRDLNQGVIDVAVIGLPSRAEGLTVEHLCDDPLVACIASSHPAARKRRISILDLQHDHLYWFDRRLNPAYYDYCQHVFKQVGFNPQRVPEPADHHVLLGLIAAGQGIALVPRSLNSMTRKGVVFKDVIEGDQLCIRIGVAYRGSGASEAVRAIVAMLQGRFWGHGRSTAAWAV